MKSATKEFTVGYTKYTPRPATVNGVAGRIWVKRQHIDGAWVHQGSNFVRKAAAEIEVEASFVSEDIDY
jgi:hypothetical protein